MAGHGGRDLQVSVERVGSSSPSINTGIFTSANEVIIDGANSFTSVAGNVYNITQQAPTIQGPPPPPPPPIRAPEHESEIYARLLLPKCNGYPIWYPPPRNSLPSEYRRQGIGIGDVGIITAYGSFDFLFNICLARDHPINGGKVPDDFEEVVPSLEERDVESVEDAWVRGSYLVGGAVKVVGHPSVEAERYTFQCQPHEGAILTHPSGGSRRDLLDLIDFRNYAGKHGISWYKYINQRRGREAANGSVYLVTGFDKVVAWGTASYATAGAGSPGEFGMSFGPAIPPTSITQGVQGTTKYSHVWHQRGLGSAKEGPLIERHSESEERPQNQCTFIRGFKVALGEGIWGSLLGKVEVRPLLGQNPAQILQKSSFVPFGGATGSGLLKFFGYGGGAAKDGGAESTTPTTPKEEEQQAVMVTSLIPQAPNELHPSTAIMRHILNKNPDTQVAVVHDQVWISLIQAGENELQNRLFLSNVWRKYAVFLSPRADRLQDAEIAEQLVKEETHNDSASTEQFQHAKAGSQTTKGAVASLKPTGKRPQVSLARQLLSVSRTSSSDSSSADSGSPIPLSDYSQDGGLGNIIRGRVQKKTVKPSKLRTLSRDSISNQSSPESPSISRRLLPRSGDEVERKSPGTHSLASPLENSPSPSGSVTDNDSDDGPESPGQEKADPQDTIPLDTDSTLLSDTSQSEQDEMAAAPSERVARDPRKLSVVISQPIVENEQSLVPSSTFLPTTIPPRPKGPKSHTFEGGIYGQKPTQKITVNSSQEADNALASTVESKGTREAQADAQSFRVWSEDDIEELARLGEGAGGVVYKVWDKQTQAVMACKTISTRASPPTRLIREIPTMSSMIHGNLAQIYGVFISSSVYEVNILMEYCEGGSLEAVCKRMQELGTIIGEPVAGNVAEGLLQGLAYLHSRKAMHRDLKPSNILLSKDGVIKLCDFGLSDLLSDMFDSHTGTSFYLAPECIRGYTGTIRSDVWSMGICLLEFVQNKFPFPTDLDTIELMMYITSEEPPRLTDEDGVQWSEDMKDFFRMSLIPDAQTRPTPAEMLGHPWIVDIMKKKVPVDKWLHQILGWSAFKVMG